MKKKKLVTCYVPYNVNNPYSANVRALSLLTIKQEEKIIFGSLVMKIELEELYSWELWYSTIIDLISILI